MKKNKKTFQKQRQKIWLKKTLKISRLNLNKKIQLKLGKWKETHSILLIWKKDSTKSLKFVTKHFDFWVLCIIQYNITIFQ